MYAEEIMTQYKQKFGGVAQLGEHLPCKQGVRSSILLISTKIAYLARHWRTTYTIKKPIKKVGYDKIYS